jgi:hypothetical protein
MPAVLLEAGSIINRDEEVALSGPERQSLISAAVVDAVDGFCAVRRPRRPDILRAGIAKPALPLNAAVQSSNPAKPR